MFSLLWIQHSKCWALLNQLLKALDTFNFPSVPNALSEVYDGRKRISVLGNVK